MGAWGVDSFENDAACDWAADFIEDGTFGMVEDALDLALDDSEDMLDASVGCEALAACEVLARLQGKSGQEDAYTEDLDAWVKANPQTPPPALVKKALKAMDRVIDPEASELRALWDEPGADGWLAKVSNLRARLG